MGEKEYRFIEKTRPEFDNGANEIYGYFHPFHKKASSVKDLVDQVINDLGRDDCIKELIIAGHGAPGTISVGNGTKGQDPAKEIGKGNEDSWGPQLDRLRCKFCPNGVVYLRGCNVGDGQKGKDLLAKIATHLVCAKVQAPTGLCNPYYTSGDDQTANPNNQPPTDTKTNPDKTSGKKKKFGFGEVKTLRAGPSIEQLIEFDASDIKGARYLPRVLGLSFSESDLETARALELPRPLVRRLARSLVKAVPLWLPSHAFSLEGYLQLQIEQPTGRLWLPPGALLGDATYYSVLRDDTRLTYLLPRRLRSELQRMQDQAIARQQTNM